MKVVNRHHHEGPWPERHYYVGRPGGIALREIARGAIDATTLGNPYTLKDHGKDAIQLYKRYLYRRLKTERSTRDFLAAIPENAVLICSCKPRLCHADAIGDAWKWLHKEQGLAQDVVVTVPEGLWHDWLDEGDLPGDEPTGEEWHFYTRGSKPDISPGCRVYVVAHGRLRGYSPLTRLVNPGCVIGLIRGANAEAVTIDEKIRGFRGWRYRWWDRDQEKDFPEWRTEGVRE